eukprot:797042-Pleurochrysis_carterae.AAC.1
MVRLSRHTSTHGRERRVRKAHASARSRATAPLAPPSSSVARVSGLNCLSLRRRQLAEVADLALALLPFTFPLRRVALSLSLKSCIAICCAKPEADSVETPRNR